MGLFRISDDFTQEIETVFVDNLAKNLLQTAESANFDIATINDNNININRIETFLKFLLNNDSDLGKYIKNLNITLDNEVEKENFKLLFSIDRGKFKTFINFLKDNNGGNKFKSLLQRGDAIFFKNFVTFMNNLDNKGLENIASLLILYDDINDFIKFFNNMHKDDNNNDDDDNFPRRQPRPPRNRQNILTNFKYIIDNCKTDKINNIIKLKDKNKFIELLNNIETENTIFLKDIIEKIDPNILNAVFETDKSNIFLEIVKYIQEKDDTKAKNRKNFITFFEKINNLDAINYLFAENQNKGIRQFFDLILNVPVENIFAAIIATATLATAFAATTTVATVAATTAAFAAATATATATTAAFATTAAAAAAIKQPISSIPNIKDDIDVGKEKDIDSSINPPPTPTPPVVSQISTTPLSPTSTANHSPGIIDKPSSVDNPYFNDQESLIQFIANLNNNNNFIQTFLNTLIINNNINNLTNVFQSNPSTFAFLGKINPLTFPPVALQSIAKKIHDENQQNLNEILEITSTQQEVADFLKSNLPAPILAKNEELFIHNEKPCSLIFQDGKWMLARSDLDIMSLIENITGDEKNFLNFLVKHEKLEWEITNEINLVLYTIISDIELRADNSIEIEAILNDPKYEIINNNPEFKNLFMDYVSYKYPNKLITKTAVNNRLLYEGKIINQIFSEEIMKIAHKIAVENLESGEDKGKQKFYEDFYNRLIDIFDNYQIENIDGTSSKLNELYQFLEDSKDILPDINIRQNAKDILDSILTFSDEVKRQIKEFDRQKDAYQNYLQNIEKESEKNKIQRSNFIGDLNLLFEKRRLAIIHSLKLIKKIEPKTISYQNEADEKEKRKNENENEYDEANKNIVSSAIPTKNRFLDEKLGKVSSNKPILNNLGIYAMTPFSKVYEEAENYSSFSKIDEYINAKLLELAPLYDIEKINIIKSMIYERLSHDEKIWSKNNILYLYAIIGNEYLDDLIEYVIVENRYVEEIKENLLKIEKFRKMTDQEEYIEIERERILQTENMQDIRKILDLDAAYNLFLELEKNENINKENNIQLQKLQERFIDENGKIIPLQEIKEMEILNLAHNDTIKKIGTLKQLHYDTMHGFINRVIAFSNGENMFDFRVGIEMLEYLKNIGADLEVLIKAQEFIESNVSKRALDIQDNAKEIIIETDNENWEYIMKKLKNLDLFNPETLRGKTIVFRGDILELISPNKEDNEKGLKDLKRISDFILKSGGKFSFVPGNIFIRNLMTKKLVSAEISDLVGKGVIVYSKYLSMSNSVVMPHGKVIDQEVFEYTKSYYGEKMGQGNYAEYISDLLNVGFKETLFPLNTNLMKPNAKYIIDILENQNYTVEQIEEITKNIPIRQFIVATNMGLNERFSKIFLNRTEDLAEEKIEMKHINVKSSVVIQAQAPNLVIKEIDTDNKSAEPISLASLPAPMKITLDDMDKSRKMVLAVGYTLQKLKLIINKAVGLILPNEELAKNQANQAMMMQYKQRLSAAA
ncbi:MAG: hypothetical protein LBF97_06290 [Elusimicrobiota bacterium]|nr:hypothetical protein [Elusimicrobiota bacterium]